MLLSHFLLEKVRNSNENTWDKRESFDVHLYQKDQKLVKKCLSYGHFLLKRLRDSIEDHKVKKRSLWRSFVSGRSKICQEMAELWPFSP